MNTKCLDRLNWFIEKSKKDKWQLTYDKNLSTNVFGIIDYDEDTHGYKFLPVLHNGFKVFGVVVKN